MSRPTIKDVSRLAAVSVSTVSNVINHHPNVTDSTRRKVMDAIDKLGYQVNRAARSLPAGQTGLIGYRMPEAGSVNSSMDSFLHQVVASAGLRGLEVLLFTPRPGQSELDAYRDVLQRGGVDAFVLAGIEYDDARIAYLSERGVPYAAFGRAPGRSNAIYADVDGAAGIRAAVDHLVEVGSERIAFLGWPEGSLTGDVRFAGWYDGLTANGLKPDEELIYRLQDSYERGREVAGSLVERDAQAVVCVSDTFALGVIAGLAEIRQPVGESSASIRVVGFDDISAASLISPGLSSIRQPMDAVGETLVNQLAKILAGDDPGPPKLLVPELVVRGSTVGPDPARDPS